MTTSKLSLFEGPHVGSFQNRDFKENAFHWAKKSGVPLSFIIYDEKIEVEKMGAACVSVFGADALGFDEDPVPLGDRLGITRFMRAIDAGHAILVATLKERVSENIAGHTSTGAGKLFHLARAGAAEMIPKDHNIAVWESPSGTVRVFTVSPKNLAAIKPSVRAFIEKLESADYTSVDI